MTDRNVRSFTAFGSGGAAREKPAGAHLTYARHVDDHTIETRDGLLMQCIDLRGLLFETADGDEPDYRKMGTPNNPGITRSKMIHCA